MKKILMGAFLCFLCASFLGAGTIRVRAPVGGESLTLNSSFVIQWEATDVSGNFNVVLIREGAIVGRIATGLPSSTRTFTWRVGEMVRGSAVAGERGDTEVRIDVRLLPRRAGCDANDRNNSLAHDLRLRPYESAHDLQVQILQDIALTQTKLYLARFNWKAFIIKAAFKVRDFPGGTAEPVTDIRCRWSILRKNPDGRWEEADSGSGNYVILPLVGSSDWVTKDIESEFMVRGDYYQGLQLVVEVDCDNRINDIDRRNNRRDLSFNLGNID